MLRSISIHFAKVNAALLHIPRNYNSSFIHLKHIAQRGNVAAASRILVSSTKANNLHLSAPRCARESHEDIDNTLLRLDQEIRRTGRVARQEIDEILQDIRDMKKATSNQSLMIIRCCGELVPSETPENRTKLVQEVWKTMENLNVPIDISHYNALLRVYLENEYKFNPTEFLQELSNKGLEPNRVTYQRLIARFCQDGDIDGASTILQHMKEKQLPINEYVFNSLVNGHARADDMESAEGIISVMKQAGLEPNDDTYVTLMCGYASKGDLQNINRIVQECKDKEVHLIDRDFLNIIHALASNGHEPLVEEILPMLRKQTGFNQDATNLILRLISIGQVDVAYRVLKEMTKIVRNDEVLPSGNFFITQLVHTSPAEQIIKFSKMLTEDGLNSYALSKACDVALQYRMFDKAVELLEAFRESGAQLRQHYFWPFFAASVEEKDVYQGIKTMKFLEIPPTTETLRDYVIPALLKHHKGQSVEKTLEQLSNYTGIPLRVLVPIAMLHLISERNIEEAIKFATKYRLQFSNSFLRKSLVDMYFNNKDAKAFVQIIGTSGLDGDDKARESVGQIILEISERAREKARFLAPLLAELLKNGIGLSNSGAELILNNLGHELTPELTSTIEKLTSSDLTPNLDIYSSMRQAVSNQHTMFEDKSVAELEAMHEEALKSGKPTRGLKKALLFAYCRRKDVEKAEAIKQELDAEGFVFPTGLKALLLDMYSQCNKLTEAKALYNGMKDTLDSPLDDTKLLHYAGALALNDEFDECLNFLQNAVRDETRKPTGGLQQAAVWKILNAAADKGKVELVQKLFDCLLNRNLLYVNNVTLGPLVKAYIVKDNLEGALTEFERCVKEHHTTPWKQELFCRFIKLEDTDRLQRIIDLSTTLHGEVNTMYDLVFAFIQCGKLRQAKKILETPGLRSRNDKIEITCQKYLEENRTDELENLIQISKDVVHLDRNAMYYYLLQAYCKNNDADKALSVWTSLQEESIQPSTELLVFLADFLRKMNKPVPFVVPEVETVETPKSAESQSSQPSQGSENKPYTSTSSSTLRKFRQFIEKNEIEEAIQMKQRLEGVANLSSEKLTIADLSLLVDKMVRAERLGEATRLVEEMMEKGLHPYPRVLRFMLGRLSSAGEVDVLTRLENKLTPDLKRLTMFNTRLSVAYVNAGRGKEYFETFVKQRVENMTSEEDSSIPLSASTYILTRHEDLLSEFEEVAAKAEQKGNLNLQNSLWSYHLLKKNFDKARELWNNKLKNEKRLMFRTVMVESKVKQDEEIAKELVRHVLLAENISDTAKASVHSCVVDILCSKGKLDEALEYFKTSLQHLKIEDYSVEHLQNLKKLLESADKQFPYTIPESTKRSRKPSLANADNERD